MLWEGCSDIRRGTGDRGTGGTVVSPIGAPTLFLSFSWGVSMELRGGGLLDGMMAGWGWGRWDGEMVSLRFNAG